MSIESQLTALATNKAAIKAAIEAKTPATAPTDALAQWPTSIASIPSGSSGNDLEPYPWVGSGTHAWLHYDSNSSSHVCNIRIVYSGNITIDWGDDSPTVSLTNGNYTTSIQTHTYADGDWRIDISGNTPLCFGAYTYDGSYHNTMTAGAGFITSETFGSNFTNAIGPRDAIVQFETDSPMFVGNGNTGYSQIGATSNMRWIKFTEATVIANMAIDNSIGLIGLFAPKCKRMWGNIGLMPNLIELSLPAIETFFNEAESSPLALSAVVPSLRSLTIPSGMSTLPQNFMRSAYSIRSINLPSTLSGTVTGILYAPYSLGFIEFPEGITEISGETCRDCVSMRKVVLPSTLESIPNQWAFYGTYALETIICRAIVPPTLGHSNILAQGKGNAGFAVWVPQGTISAYEAAANWSQFSGKFHELDASGNIPTA